MIVIGLTGGIGMGKTAAAGMFRTLGIAVSDADLLVHQLYRKEAVADIAMEFPEALRNGIIDRQILGRLVESAPNRLERLEGIIHPRVRRKQTAFLEEQRAAGAAMAVLDIPLLFETGADARVDVKAVVSCDPEIQAVRVLARPNMTPEKFALFLSRQMPDAERRKRADFVIDTGNGFDAAQQQIRAMIDELKIHGETPTD